MTNIARITFVKAAAGDAWPSARATNLLLDQGPLEGGEHITYEVKSHNGQTFRVTGTYSKTNQRVHFNIRWPLQLGCPVHTQHSVTGDHVSIQHDVDLHSLAIVPPQKIAA